MLSNIAYFTKGRLTKTELHHCSVQLISATKLKLSERGQKQHSYWFFYLFINGWTTSKLFEQQYIVGRIITEMKKLYYCMFTYSLIHHRTCQTPILPRWTPF